jgi:hypothetical protein
MTRKMRPPKSAETVRDEMVPILLTQQMHRDNVLQSHMNDRKVLGDTIQRLQSEQARVMAVSSVEALEKSKSSQAKAETDRKEMKGTTSYAITYYNPELKKAEVLEGKTDIRIKDSTLKAAEESVASSSMYPVYNYIAEPMMRKEIEPWKLERILEGREYGTPPTSGTGAAVVPVRLVEQKAKESLESKKMDDMVRVSLNMFVVRKERCEVKIGEQILVLEGVVDALGKGEALDKAISRLPPLSKARYLLLLRKKRANAQLIINMLVRDISFLRHIRKKLTLFTIDDVIGMLKGLTALKKKS